MQELTRQVKRLAREQGLDLVGIAPLERFAQAPELTHPTHYLPQARCVVSIGLRILDGACDLWAGDPHVPHKSAGPYLFYGYGLLNLELGRAAYRLAKLLEEAGYRSQVFPPTWTVGRYRFLEEADRRGDWRADFSHRHAAVAAGLGEFGLNGLVLSRHGARYRFNSIITEAPLRPDPMYAGARLCRPEACRQKCLRECPAAAFDRRHMLKADFGERSYQYCALKKPRCIMGAVWGLLKGTGGYSQLTPPAKAQLGMADARQALADASEPQKRLLNNLPGLLVGDFCGVCLHGCPAYRWPEAAGHRQGYSAVIPAQGGERRSRKRNKA